MAAPDTYPDLNPRWVAFCEHHQLDPRTSGAETRGKFLTWIARELKGFRALHEIHPDEVLSAEQQEAFTAFLEAR